MTILLRYIIYSMNHADSGNGYSQTVAIISCFFI